MKTPRVPRLSHVKRPLRILIGATLTALATAYILLKIDLEQTWETLTSANLWWFGLAVTIMIVTALPMALRWKWLLAAQGVLDRFWWLTRSYFVSYTAGQILPTSIGGDAVRIFEISKRHPGRSGDLTAIVVIERGLGGAATVLLGAIGFVLAIGHYDVSAYLWIEGLFVFGTLLLLVLFFSRTARPHLARLRPVARKLRIERPLRAFYDGVHHYRGHPGLMIKVFVFTTVIQAVRILSIWAACKSVGIDLGPRIYYVMGPLFFLVLLVPFTLNGFAVREAFFVSFLGSVGVDADAAFAAGFLFFLVTVALALPGGVILLWESIRGGARPEVGHG
ncbi:MAG: flippase-like domain-containing protein [Thermoleophilia bacterium]|nr:flippase-like domain-containing protein [Thermoleophilia bacterium]